MTVTLSINEDDKVPEEWAIQNQRAFVETLTLSMHELDNVIWSENFQNQTIFSTVEQTVSDSLIIPDNKLKELLIQSVDDKSPKI